MTEKCFYIKKKNRQMRETSVIDRRASQQRMIHGAPDSISGASHIRREITAARFTG